MKTKEFLIEDAEGRAITLKIAPTPLVYLVDSRRLFDANALDTREGMEALITAIFHGARRGGTKAVTLEWLTDNVDTHNAPALFGVFRELNEIAVKSNGATPPGEALAASSTTTMESLPTS